MVNYVTSVPTPMGLFTLTGAGDAVSSAGWRLAEGEPGCPVLEEAAAQVTAYFEGRLQVFDLPLRVEGSDLVRRVCDLLCAIPFGHTRTYCDLARDLGQPPQPVGQACGRNPIPLIIPCHRVLSATGLGGFSAPGGVETKVALLRHEGAAGLLI